MRQWPWLRQACATIAYNCGMVNMFCPEDDAVEEMVARAESVFEWRELQSVDHWLLYVPGDDLDLDGPWFRVCNPCDDELDVRMPDIVQFVLNEAFGG